MANRYWVGGSGTWNSSSTTNWSASSGGASGASVPTAADSVFFDQAGTYTVTVSATTAAPVNCLDLTKSAGTVSFSGNLLNQTNAFNIYGNLTFTSGGGINTGNIWFRATSPKTISHSGTTGTLSMIMDGVGGSWTLGAALTATSMSLVITEGTFSTSASNYNLTVNSITISANSNTKGLSLNGSTVTCATFTNSSTGGFTFNAGTSTYTMSGNPSRILSGGVTFATVKSGTVTAVFLDNFSCANFDSTPLTGANPNIVLCGDLTVSGVLTTSTTSFSTALWRRPLYRSSIPGTARTITAGSFSVFYTDFEDMTKSGAALTGTSVGDCGGNTNITATAAKTVYISASGSSAVSATSGTVWSTSSNGSTAIGNFPLPQDTVIVDDSSCTSGGTITFDTYSINLGTVSFSGRTNPMTLGCTGYSNSAASQSTRIYSSISVPSNIPLTGTFGFSGRGTQAVTLSSTSSTAVLYFSGSGTVRLAANLTTTGLTYLMSGTLDLNSYALKAGGFLIYVLYVSPYPSRSVAFNGGYIELTGSGAIFDENATGTITVTGTPNIYVTYAGATAVSMNGSGTSGPTEANNFNFFFQAGTYGLTPPVSAKNVDFTGYSGNLAGSTISIYGNLTFSTGMTITTPQISFTGTSGTQTITSNGRSTSSAFIFNGVGGTYVLADALTTTRSAGTAVNLANGTLDLSGKTFTSAGNFVVSTGTKNITFNGGTVVLTLGSTTAFNNLDPTGFTTTAGTGVGKISLTAATAKTFIGGGSTFNCTLSNDGAGALTITGSNTFTTLANGVQPTTFTFTSGTTQTLTNWNVSGTLGNLVTINSDTAGSQATLSKSSGSVAANYLDIRDSNATGGASWNGGANSVNSGNNSGWFFGNPSSFFALLARR